MENACRREALEETGIKIDVLRLVGVYSDPARDPRGHTVSVAYVTILPRAVVPKAGSDAAGAEWIDDWRSVELAFDHAQILEDAEALLKLRRSRLGELRRKERALTPNQRRDARLKALSSE